MMETAGYTSAIFVSSPYHMRRISIISSRIFPNEKYQLTFIGSTRPYSKTTSQSIKYLNQLVLYTATCIEERIIKGQSSISPEMALRLFMCLGRRPESWLLMQDSYNLWQAKQSLDLSDIEPLAMMA